MIVGSSLLTLDLQNDYIESFCFHFFFPLFFDWAHWFIKYLLNAYHMQCTISLCWFWWMVQRWIRYNLPTLVVQVLFHLRAPRQAHNECCKPGVSLTTQCAFRTICFWYLLIFTKALAADCSVSLVWVYDSLGEHHESTVWSSPE